MHSVLRAGSRLLLTLVATFAARVLVAAVLLTPAALAAQSATPVTDTVRVVNTAHLVFRGEDGIDAATEATAEVVIEHRVGVTLVAPREVVVNPGQRVVLAHRMQNTGTAADSFRLDLAGFAGWGVTLHLDADGDGVLGMGDLPVSGPVPLASGQEAALLLVLDVPADAAEGVQAAVDLRATSLRNAAATAALRDLLTVHVPAAVLSLGKTVDRAEATRGDTLTYALTFGNAGDGEAAAAILTDTLPAGVRLVAGSLRLRGAALTDAADTDAGEVLRDDAGRETVRVRVGTLAPGSTGSAAFRAVVGADAAEGPVVNTGHLAAGEARVASPQALTTVALPRLEIEKERLGADSVHVGDTITYRLRWKNASATVGVRDAVLTDTLPEALTLVDAERTPEVEGQVVRWRLGALEPDATGSLTLRVLAVRASGEDGGVVNRAVVQGANAVAVTADATPVHVLSFRGNELEIAKAAGVLESGPGEVIPYAVTLRNRGVVPLRNLVVHDLLPQGTRFIRSTVVGADSVRVDGRRVTLFVAGPLAPGAEHLLRYTVSVVSPGRARTMGNRASALAEGGRVQTDTVTAWVRVRRGFAMQSRLVVGKVWLDRDADGRQDPGEEGVAAVDVWSEDGQVVTTDREGRFSFRDLRTGTHVLRLDTVALPAGFGVARRGGESTLLRLDGWTTPRAGFGLVPRGGAAAAPLAATAAPTGSASVAATAAPAVAAAAPAAAPALPSPAAATAPTAPASTSPSDIPAVGPSAPAAFAARPAIGTPANPTATPLVGMPAKPVAASAAVAAAAAAADSARPGPTVAPLRTAAEREEEDRRTFVEGPTVRIFAPVDGAVVTSNRLYVGLRGEPGAVVRLFDGDSLVTETTLRPDGVADVVGVPLAQGPRRLRAWMKNSWGQERWDSVHVHRHGEPARLETPADARTLRAESRDVDTLRVRVLDAWGVPVTGGALVTVQADRATVEGADADLSSVGLQLRADGDGWLAVPVRAGRVVGPGGVRLSAAEARGLVAVRVLPSTRPLIATGAAQVGIGAAAPEAFGAVTVRGSVGGETTVSVSVDSRRGDPEDEFFGRGYDPLDESRYPTLGDASERRVLSGATQVFSARVERGFDWMELGDVQVSGFGDERLGMHSRALTGMSGRVTTGAVVWSGFGSVTDQTLEHRQLRGDGSSGPYRLGAGIRPGTERVAVEVRDAVNAARVIAREELVRFVDYQIDYTTGEVLLQRPIPATDVTGNPIYVVATAERRTGGDARVVGGLRMEVDAARYLPGRVIDSLGVAFFGLHEAAGIGDPLVTAVGGETRGHDVFGGDVRLRRGGVDLGVQLLRSARTDSAAVAGRADVAWTLPGDRFTLRGDWLSVGSGFSSSADPRLSSGLSELRLAAEARVTERGRLRLRHERQSFHAYDVDRSTTMLQAEQTVAGRRITAEGGLASDGQGARGSALSATGKATMALTDRVEVWVDGARSLEADTAMTAARPDQVGAGMSVRVLPGTRLEGAHRWVRLPGDSATFGLSTVGLRTEQLLGGSAWGMLERADGASGQNSAVLGWNHRLAMSGGWSLNTLFERRFGLSQAPLLDPSRALPFAQAERDRWSAGLGVEYLPTDGALRFSARGERHDGRDREGYRVDVAGDAPMGRSFALLTRHDWSRDEWSDARGEQLSLRQRSTLGLAYRPVLSDEFNALAKVEWRRSASPLGGGSVLATARDEGRLIGTADAVWAPRFGTELSGRYAMRLTEARDSVFGPAPLRSTAHFAGMRLGQELHERLAARLDGRMLLEGISGESRWSVAPALALRLNPQLEVEGGYRFGSLTDPDFAVNGGQGFYATLNLRFTEGLIDTAADFWRERMGRDR